METPAAPDRVDQTVVSRETGSSALTQEQVRAEQIRLVYGGTRAVAFITLLGVTLISIAQINHVSTSILFPWAGLLLGITAGRVVLELLFNAKAPPMKDVPKWGVYFVALTIAAGLCWGAVGVFMIPAGAPIQQAFSLLTVTCFASGALVDLCYVWRTYIAFILPMGLTVVGRLLILDEPSSDVVAIAFVIYWTFLMIASRRLNQQMISNITLTFENKILAEQAQASQAETEDALERVTRDIELAKTMQEAILPHDFANTSVYEVGTYMRAARQVGGDFYDVFRIDDQRVGLAIADVSPRSASRKICGWISASEEAAGA